MAVHQAARVLQGDRVVVIAETAVRGDTGGDRLPAAVHRDLVDVGIDDEVALGDTLVDLEHLAVIGLADHRKILVVLGVVLVQHATRVEGVVDPVAQHVAQLVLVHPPVQSERGDEMDVVDPGGRRQVEHGLDDPLAGVGSTHFRQ